MTNQFANVFMLSAIVATCSIAHAAQETSSRRTEAVKSEFGVRQRLVERKMLELEDQLTLIADRIREKNPEKADRLVHAYQQSRERLITAEMAKASQLLDSGQLTEANNSLDQVIANLDELIRLLVNEKAPEISKQQEIEMLEKWKQEVQQRMAEQAEQQQETAKISDREQTLKQLADRIKQLNELIEKQQNLAGETDENRDAGLRQLDRIADQQFKLRKQTSDLERELGTSKVNKAGDMDQPVKPGEGEGGAAGSPSEGSDDNEAGGSESGSSESAEAKSGEPGSGQPGQSNPSQGSSPGQESSGESSSNSTPSQPPQPGQQPLQQAAENQRKAEEQLGSGRADDARQSQEEAIEQMQKAVEELDREKRRIESLPPDAIEQLARQQRRTRDKTMDIARQMDKAPKPKPEGDQASGSDQQQQPGQQQLEEASESMQQAANDLQNDDGDAAQQQQSKAQEKMQQAMEEIEERLNQLRDETREEKLARLESRFNEMLQRQQVASEMTVELNDKQSSLGPLKRRDQLLLMRVANDEREISELGQQAYDLLLEDGTSIVFPEVVQDLRTDLNHVADLLDDQRIDRFTQLVQKEIEASILDLLDALKEAQQENDGGGGGGGGGGGDQPLLKKSAELKILRMQQQRLNRRTRRVEQLRQQRDLDPVLVEEIDGAAELQGKLLEMTERIMEKDEG